MKRKLGYDDNRSLQFKTFHLKLKLPVKVYNAILLNGITESS